MTLSGRQRRRKNVPPALAAHYEPEPPKSDAPLREFAYLDEVSVQSLLVSLVGALPSEITSLSSRSKEAEIGGAIGATAPLIAKAELTSRFAGSSTSSSQVLSRAVSESLFKHLYELVEDRLVWSPTRSPGASPISIERGSLIEIEVVLAPDPIYGFNATMGVFSELAADYPALLDDENTALIMAQAEPINKVLERLLVGLIPIKSAALGLQSGVVDGTATVAPSAYFDERGVDGGALHIVGVTEHDKYWRDVRRVLFSQSTFTVLGRIGRSGVQANWTPVKLTEVMRDIAPQFPDAITRVGRIGYSAPVNTREELNRDALERALVHVALEAGGESAVERRDEVAEFARTQRVLANTLKQQGAAFDRLIEWMVEQEILDSVPENVRLLRNEAREVSGLRSNTAGASLADFVTPSPMREFPDESLIDLEIIAIYW